MSGEFLQRQFEPQFSDNGYERIRLLGNFGLKLVQPEFLELEFPYPDQSSDYLITGNLDGVLKLDLVFEFLPESEKQGFLINGEIQSRADYLWDFFIRHRTPFRRPFLCPHPLKKYDMLWILESEVPEFQLNSPKAWSTSVRLKQYVGPQDSFTDTNGNIDSI